MIAKHLHWIICTILLLGDYLGNITVKIVTFVFKSY